MTKFSVATGPSLVGLKHKETVISGTVSIGGSPAVREIKVFKNGYETIIGRTRSASDGTFSISVNAGAQDRIGVICISNSDNENSLIFDRIRE